VGDRSELGSALVDLDAINVQDGLGGDSANGDFGSDTRRRCRPHHYQLPTLEEPRMKRPVALLTVLASVAVSSAAGTAPADAAVLDGTCVASITLNFTPPATQPLPPNPAPAATSTGTGTITTCVFPGGGATTGTFTYALAGNLTCISAANVTGTLDIAWSDASQTHATVTGLVSVGSLGGAAGLSATVTSGRFTGDRVVIANVRDPLALIACLTTGLAQASGTTSLTFTQPLPIQQPRRPLHVSGRAQRKLSLLRRPSAAARSHTRAGGTR
jgi:hypothetical protein